MIPLPIAILAIFYLLSALPRVLIEAIVQVALFLVCAWGVLVMSVYLNAMCGSRDEE